MAKIVLENLAKRFGDLKAVDDVNLTVADQEFMVLVGPSGCGKTTALRMIAGLERPTSGHIYMDDIQIDRIPPGSRDIAMVFQNYALFAHMNVYDNLSFGLKIRKTPKAEIPVKVSQIAEMLQLENLLERMPRQLSGGERQRVALGRALIRNPKLYLMDEPLSNLDALLRVQMRTEILKLCKDLRVTVIHVTHDQTEALSMGDRIAVMRAGCIEQVGTPEEVYDRPINRYVASFIGSPMMNFVEEGHLVSHGTDLFFESPDFRLPLAHDMARRIRGLGSLADVADDVVFGVRPEAIRLGIGGGGDRFSDPISASVDLVQSLGSQMVISISIGNIELVVLGDPAISVTRGEQTQAMFDRIKIHLFRRSTGESILYEAD